jgi:hypothetical protein
MAGRDQRGALTGAWHFGQSNSRPSRRASTTSFAQQPRHRKITSMLKISGGYTAVQPDTPRIVGKPGTGTERWHRVHSITFPAKDRSAVRASPQTAQKNKMDDMVWKRLSRAI